MKVLTGLELLATKAEEWDNHQPKRYTLQQELAGTACSIFLLSVHISVVRTVTHVRAVILYPRHLPANCPLAQDGAAHVASDTALSVVGLQGQDDPQILVPSLHAGALR